MLKKIKEKVSNFLKRQNDFWRFFIFNYLSTSRYSIVIIDDIYPLPLSAFRITEFNYYLSYFSESIIYVTGEAFQYLNINEKLNSVIQSHLHQYPEHNSRIIEFDPNRRLKAKLVYIIFLHNTYRFLPIIEKNSIPFVFTLYPGGGFLMNEENTNNQLKRIFDSIFFRKVIVTQKITFDYLVQNNLCSKEKIELVYGVVMPIDELHHRTVERTEVKVNFDLCFVANKYMPLGVDKGYDTFIALAKKLSSKYADMKFHVVGTFDRNDINVDGYDNIIFYGSQKTSFFPEFYSNMDIIVSPNVPFKLGNGAFDGFPTGGCVEAGLMGVALFCSDSIGQNVHFNHKEDIVIIKNDVDDICLSIEYYYHNYPELQNLRAKGKNKLETLFNINTQMSPRIKVLTSILDAQTII